MPIVNKLAAPSGGAEPLCASTAQPESELDGDDAEGEPADGDAPGREPPLWREPLVLASGGTW